MVYGGIDGCKYGWILIKSSIKGLEFGRLYPSIQALIELNQDLDRILIDIPIGLSSKNRIRTIESLMRQELKGRQSTVFNAPCRETLIAKNHKEATQINREIEGKGISMQTYNISKKIEELDNLVTKNTSLKDKTIESHPEICFKYLNDGKVVHTKKSSTDGIKERLDILQKYDSNVKELYENIEKKTMKKHAKRDDIIDAICLCLVNKLSGKNGMCFINDPLKEDDLRIKMRIGYFKK